MQSAFEIIRLAPQKANWHRQKLVCKLQLKIIGGDLYICRILISTCTLRKFDECMLSTCLFSAHSVGEIYIERVFFFFSFLLFSSQLLATVVESKNYTLQFLSVLT